MFKNSKYKNLGENLYNKKKLGVIHIYMKVAGKNIVQIGEYIMM